MEENKNNKTSDERTEEEVIAEIKHVLDKVRPYLNSEGGDLEYVDFKDGVVSIRLLGACVGCGAIDYTLKDGIEALLVEYVPEVIEVRNVSETEESQEGFGYDNFGGDSVITDK